MAYHLSQEARDGLTQFNVPKIFEKELFDFQKAAVKIAAYRLNKRDGVLIGDVVGLGKTLMATALAKTFEDDHGFETLIICPKNLVPMWEDYRLRYGLRGKVISFSKVKKELPKLPRHRLVLIDESHNLRNREGTRYRHIAEYIEKNDSKVILLSATPYNKTYLDLSSQLRLFIDAEKDIGIRPEKLLREIGETEFIRRHQCPVRSLAAFEKSEHPDDWRDLMRLYLVRRTRSFINDNYSKKDETTGKNYLEFSDGSRSYFTTRKPKTIKFAIDETNTDDQYAKLFDSKVVDKINDLTLPRYGLGGYRIPDPKQHPSKEEEVILGNLSHAGSRLKGFCRTNLFKRLESSGHSFLLSIKRHILRNFVWVYAIENGLPLQIGTQQADILDLWEENDGDLTLLNADEDDDEITVEPEMDDTNSEEYFRSKAKEVYTVYQGKYKSRFKWIRHDLFKKELVENLRQDAAALIKIFKNAKNWNSDHDAKLEALLKLITKKHPKKKILIFSQYADTVQYLTKQLKQRKINNVEGVTGATFNPTDVAQRFSPNSNNPNSNKKNLEQELRIVVATDVLSEGQNLQDCSIVVNYDLPWAIIRLIQRAGRVDRIGQTSDTILCYSFLPADGVERIINLRRRVFQRLNENAEVVGADERFFEGQKEVQNMKDLYTEKAGTLDDKKDDEVDLASFAYQIWKNAIDEHPELKQTIPDMPNVVFSTKKYEPAYETKKFQPEGVLVYLKTADENDALAWIDDEGKSVTESQFEILKAAECQYGAKPLAKNERHHELVEKGVHWIIETEKAVGGQLGRPHGARFQTYERLKRFVDEPSIKNSFFDTAELRKTIDEIYQYPLCQSATDSLNRQLRSGITDTDLAELAIGLRADGRLCRVEQNIGHAEPQVICSLGLKKNDH